METTVISAKWEGMSWRAGQRSAGDIMLQIDEMMDGETNDICGYDVMGQVFGI